MNIARLLGAVLGLATSLLGQSTPNSVTVPVTLDHNRTIIDVRLKLPGGTTTRVRAWVDTGNPELWITADLAKKLGLTLSGDPRPTLEGKERASTTPAEVQISGMSVSLTGVKEAHAVLDRESIAPGCSAAINLPSTVLRGYDLIFDYPNRQFTIGTPGSVQFRGTPSKATINAVGLVQVLSKIQGQSYNLGLDTGASFSLISSDLLNDWHKTQPSWPFVKGALGAANMWGIDGEQNWALLRLPSVLFGQTTLQNVGAAAFPQEGVKWFEQRAGISTIGLLGGNAFRNLRVGIDYAHSMIYLEATGASPSSEIDVVGLTLRPEPDGRYTVLGVSEIDGKSAVPGVRQGDALLGVDGAPVTGATMGQVWSLLGGTPGQARKLVLERNGQRLTVDATVQRFLAEPQTK